MAKIIFLVLFAVQLIIGICTVHVVQHWDEAKLVDSVIEQYSHGRFLPIWYNYPSVIFYITYIDYFFWQICFKNIIGDFNIFNRMVFYCLSTLPALFIFNTFRRKGLEWIGLITAIIFMGSWEFHYHSRWVAPDTILALFATASICYLLKGNLKSYIFASVMAGIAFSTKYTAGIFILPVILLMLMDSKTRSFKNIAFAMFLFIVTFFVCNPGIILEWAKASQDILFEQQHYAKGHNNYTVDSFALHLKRNILYLLAILPSKNIVLGICISLFIPLGLFALIREKRFVWIYTGIIACCFLLYLSSQKVMFVRNLIVWWPIICILAGYSMCYLYIKIAKFNKIIVTAFLIMGLLSLSFVIRTDIKLLQSNEYTPVENFVKYKNSNPHKKIWTSPVVRSWLSKIKQDYIEIDGPKENAEYFVLYLWEAQQWKLPANEYGWLIRTFGSEDINISYYPTYPGNQKIIMVKNPNILLDAGIQL